MTLKRSAIVAIAMAGTWLGIAVAAQSGEQFTARLAWVPTAGAERVTGKGSATATLSGRTLSIAGSFEGLAGPATAARLHRGVAKGARGAAISDLMITKGTSGMISGSVMLTAEQMESLRQGKLYVLVHSEKGVTPDGSNLWGWFLR